MYTKRLSNPRIWCTAAVALMLGAFAGTAFADTGTDPPDRVARVSYLQGDVSFQPAGDDQWAQVSLNRPLSTGDKLYTDRNSRAELEIGAAAVRLDQSSTFDLLNLNDTTAQIELTSGVMDLRVRRLATGESYEVDTPTLAFVVGQPGNYRIDIAPDGNSTMVTVFDGAGDVYGADNASYSVRSGNSYRFNDSALKDYEVLDLPQPDDFDNWCASRDQRVERSVSRQYVSDDVIGYSDLDDNGTWSNVPDYGNVWYPTTVAAGWAPYRSGYWSWIDPWGWSWIDSAAWGFAPFHYGRWAFVGNRWGWCPGERDGRAIYAPAMVAFVGGGGWGTDISIGIGGGPIGWFPLGPRDVYVPWYQASRGYFTNINVRNTRVINNTYITNVYNDYSRGRPITNAHYAYRNNVAALTAVPRAAFIGARPVNAARVQVNDATFRNAQIVSRVGITPVRASFMAANAARTRAVPRAAVLQRGVIARTAPPARPIPIASRLQAIERNGAQPLQRSQLSAIAARPGAGRTAAPIPSRVQVVGHAGKPQPLPMRGAAAANPPTTRGAPAKGRASAAIAPNAINRNALPSSRFAPHAGASRGTPENRDNTAPVRGNTASPVQNRALPTPRPVTTKPAQRSGNETAPARSAPSTRYAPRNETVPQRAIERAPAATPRSNSVIERNATRSTAPAQRRAPESQREIRPAPQVRELPRNVQPAQRYNAPQREQQPRVEPRPQQQPQQRPQLQQRVEPQQRAQPQQRRAPEKDKDKDENNGHQGR